MIIATLILLFLILLALGVPIATSLGLSGAVTIITFGLGADMIGMNFISSVASFPLVAIPFFVLGGSIMEKSGLAATIADLFETLVGGITGGLAMVAVLTGVFWGAISGSGPATAVALTLILVNPMIKQGYDKHFAAATIASASDLSIIIPPSIVFVIYGCLTSTSIGALFLAGVIPGLLMGAASLVAAFVISKRHGYRGEPRQTTPKEFFIKLKKASWALFTPVVILGGIYGGIFTPTEAAVVAVFYSLIIARFVYRTIDFKMLYEILVDSAVTSAVIMFIVACAGIFSWAATVTGFVDTAANFIIAHAPGKFTVIFGINILLLILGMFLDAVSISYLVMPILIPVLQAFGIDPVWYGVIFITAMAIGLITPPVGVNLFTVASLTNSRVGPIARQAIPYVVASVAALFILSLFPEISTWLPRRAGLIP